MNDDDRRRCEQLAYRSKRGQHISPDELQWMESMWKQYPDEYSEIGDAVRERTTRELNPLYEGGAEQADG